jgi:uncharacterized membrane protein YoaK (UPF0700 family)
MGIQGATVRQLGEVSTTYLTGTLTGVLAGLATGRKPNGLERSLGIFVALIVGACASAVVTAYAPALLPLVMLLPLALVVWIASARFGPRPGWPGTQAGPDHGETERTGLRGESADPGPGSG